MSLPDSQVREVSTFNGPWLRVDPYLRPPDKGMAGRNVEYTQGQVATRLGYLASGIVNGFSDAVVSLANWKYSIAGVNKSLLLYYGSNTGAVRFTDLLDGSTFNFFTQAGAAGASFVSAGQRVYFAFFSTAALGVGTPQVYISGTASADPLFPAPPNATPAIQEVSGILTPVSAGTKRFGYVANTRSGFTTVVAPLANGKFSPVSFAASGSNQLSMTITPPAGGWPVYVQSVQAVMTTSTDLNTYYLVPGATNFVSGTTPVTLNIGITDSDLSATGTHASVFADEFSGNMACYHLFPCGQRMCYLAVDLSGFPVAYFSESNQYQSLTADQHGVYLPNQERAISGTQFRGSVYYLMCAHATYSVADNADVPATWPVEQIDDKIGTLSPHGVCMTTGGIWVAAETGLYLFDGAAYATLPVSYYCDPDWKRINWGAASCVEVVDDREKHRVHVKAPLDGATSPTHILTFDYTNGREPENINYSLDNLSGYSLGSIAVVENYTTKLNEVWVSSTNVSQPFLRAANSNDATPYRDNTAGIASLYEFGLLPGLSSQVPREQLNFHSAAHMRVAGFGQLFLKLWTADHNRYATPARSPLILNTLTEPEPLVRFPITRAEQCSLQFSNIDGTGAAPVDTYFRLNYLKYYYNPGPPMR